jgi:hypothetical protein
MSAILDTLQSASSVAETNGLHVKPDRVDHMLSVIQALLVEDAAAIREHAEGERLGSAELQALLTLLERGTVLAEQALKLAKLRDATRAAVPVWAHAARRVTLMPAH